MIGSDDVLACFIAGNVFTWDDWFRLETKDDSLQPTIDMLLNVSIFMWFGAVCPWHKFVDNNVIPIYRLVPLGILVLLFRRLPMVLTFHKLGFIHQIQEIRHALFVGFFGPIGVSAIFYLYITREFLVEILVDDHERSDAEDLAEITEVVVWFLIICSIFVHGLSIALGKLGFYLPRTVSTAISTERISAAPSMTRGSMQADDPQALGLREYLPRSRPEGVAMHRRETTSERGEPVESENYFTLVPRSIARTFQHIWHDVKRPHLRTVHGKEDGTRGENEKQTDPNGTAHPEISGPSNARPLGRSIGMPSEPSPDGMAVAKDRRPDEERRPASTATSAVQSPHISGASTPVGRGARVITFADENGSSDESSTPIVPAAEDRKES